MSSKQQGRDEKYHPGKNAGKHAYKEDRDAMKRYIRDSMEFGRWTVYLLLAVVILQLVILIRDMLMTW